MVKIYLPTEIAKRLKNLAKLDRDISGYIILDPYAGDDLEGVSFVITGIGKGDTVIENPNLIRSLEDTLNRYLTDSGEHYFLYIPFHTHCANTIKKYRDSNPFRNLSKQFSTGDIRKLRKNARKDGFAATILATPHTIIGTAVNEFGKVRNLEIDIADYGPLFSDYTFGCESEGVDTPYKEALGECLEKGMIPEHFVEVYMGRDVKTRLK